MADTPPEMQSMVKLKDKLEVRTLERAQSRPAVVTETLIKQALVKTVPSLAFATAITVNGQDVVAVSDEATAEAVKESILDEYKDTVLKDASVEQLAFQEQIDWHPKVVPTERVRSSEEAISILKHGTDRVVTYHVKDGDTGWDIARSYNVSTDQLAKANPNVNLDIDSGTGKIRYFNSGETVVPASSKPMGAYNAVTVQDTNTGNMALVINTDFKIPAKKTSFLIAILM
jgi:LysM repeat protein